MAKLKGSARPKGAERKGLGPPSAGTGTLQVRRSDGATRREQKTEKLRSVGGWGDGWGEGSTSAGLADARLCGLTLCSSGSEEGAQRWAARPVSRRRKAREGRSDIACRGVLRSSLGLVGSILALVSSMGGNQVFRWEIGRAAPSVARYRQPSGHILVAAARPDSHSCFSHGKLPIPIPPPTSRTPPLSTVRRFVRQVATATNAQPSSSVFVPALPSRRASHLSSAATPPAEPALSPSPAS